MANLSDFIESYIKRLLEENRLDEIDLKRNELAEKLKCVPSQINYVLSTRFTTEQGFLVESRRGGGGYIRITKITFNETDREISSLISAIGESISQLRAEGLIRRLYEDGFLSKKEMYLIAAAIDRNNIPLADPIRDKIRALILKSMLRAALKRV